MIELLLHIGGEKTGSTSIQASLRSSRERLAADGILVPRALGEGNQVPAYIYASDGEVDELKGQLGVTSPDQLAAFRARVRRELRAEVAAAPALRTVVVSNEHLSSRLRRPAELARLHALFAEALGPFTCRIVYFARPQWELVPSLYSTYVKTGGQAPLRYPFSEQLDAKLRHLRIVELWRAAFPGAVLDVRGFSTADAGYDVVRAFGELLGCATPLDPVAAQNVSLSAPATELMRIFNAHVPRTVEHRFNPARGNIQQLLEAQPGPPLEIPLALQGAIAAEFAGENARLNALAGREVIAPRPDLVAQASPDATHDVPLALALDEAVRLLGACFAAKQTQFLQVRARGERLHAQLEALRRDGRAPGAGAPASSPHARTDG